MDNQTVDNIQHTQLSMLHGDDSVGQLKNEGQYPPLAGTVGQPIGMPAAGTPVSGQTANPQGIIHQSMQAPYAQPYPAPLHNNQVNPLPGVQQMNATPVMALPGVPLNQEVKQAPAYPVPTVQGYAAQPDLGASSYERKYTKQMVNAKTWRCKICIGLAMVIFMVFSLILGIVGVSLAAGVVDKGGDQDKADVSARIIVDALGSWDEPTLTDIAVLEGNQNCAEGWESIFSIEWLGTKSGCYDNGRVQDLGQFKSEQDSKSSGYVGTTAASRARAESRKNENAKCNNPINSLDPVEQTIFSGKKFCGHYNGPKLVDTPEPSQLDAEAACSSGFTVCSTNTTEWYNRVCVADADYPAKCPITDIRFLPTAQAYLGWDRTSVPFLSGVNSYDITWTKTEATAGPITKTHVVPSGTTPCMDPKQVLAHAERTQFYPLEINDEQQATSCSISVKEIKAEDTRYFKVGEYNSNMYEVQTASGVLTALSALKDYEKFVPDNSIKLGLEYDFFARSAVQWSCSKAKMAEAVEAMKNVDIEGQEDGKDLLQTAMIMGIVYLSVIVPVTVIIFLMFVKCRTHKSLKWIVGFTLLGEFALSLTCMILSFMAGSKYHGKHKELKDLDKATEGCMIGYDYISNSMVDYSKDLARDGGTASAVMAVFATSVVVKILFIMVIGASIMYISRNAIRQAKTRN